MKKGSPDAHERLALLMLATTSTRNINSLRQHGHATGLIQCSSWSLYKCQMHTFSGVSPGSWQPQAGCASSAQQPAQASSAEPGRPAALHEPAWLDGQLGPALPSHLLLLPPPVAVSVCNMKLGCNDLTHAGDLWHRHFIGC